MLNIKQTDLNYEVDYWCNAVKTMSPFFVKVLDKPSESLKLFYTMK